MPASACLPPLTAATTAAFIGGGVGIGIGIETFKNKSDSDIDPDPDTEIDDKCFR